MEIGLTSVHHAVVIAHQSALVILFYLKRGIYFEDRVKGWLNESINNYRENNVSTWDIFQHKFGCCGIESYTEWCNVTGLIPSLSRKPDFSYCDVIGEITHVIFDAWCQTAVVSKIEEGLTGILYSYNFQFFVLFWRWHGSRNETANLLKRQIKSQKNDDFTCSEIKKNTHRNIRKS